MISSDAGIFHHIRNRHPRINPPAELDTKLSDTAGPFSDTGNDHQFVARNDKSWVLPQIEQYSISC